MKTEVRRETKTNIKLVQLMAEDADMSEIGKVMGVGPMKVYERICKLKEKYECKNISSLITIFYKNQLIK